MKHMTAISTLIALLFITAGISTSALASHRTVQVQKADGSVGQYQLMPVVLDPLHPSVVMDRLLQEPPTAVKPAAGHQISIDELSPVRDQGQRGTCVYFAVSGAIEANYIAKGTARDALSVSQECLVDFRSWEFQTASYQGADKSDFDTQDGDWPSHVVKTIKMYGVPANGTYGTGSTAVNCNYLESDKTVVSKTQYVAAIAASSAYGKGFDFAVNTAPTVSAITAILDKNIPVQVGILFFDEFSKSADWRFNKKIDKDDSADGGHSVILTGYQTKGKKTIFTFKNSWGAAWGKAGFGTMDDQLLIHSWAANSDYDTVVSINP